MSSPIDEHDTSDLAMDQQHQPSNNLLSVPTNSFVISPRENDDAKKTSAKKKKPKVELDENTDGFVTQINVETDPQQPPQAIHVQNLDPELLIPLPFHEQQQQQPTLLSTSRLLQHCEPMPQQPTLSASSIASNTLAPTAPTIVNLVPDFEQKPSAPTPAPPTREPLIISPPPSLNSANIEQLPPARSSQLADITASNANLNTDEAVKKDTRKKVVLLFERKHHPLFRRSSSSSSGNNTVTKGRVSSRASSLTVVVSKKLREAAAAQQDEEEKSSRKSRSSFPSRKNYPNKSVYARFITNKVEREKQQQQQHQQLSSRRSKSTQQAKQCDPATATSSASFVKLSDRGQVLSPVKDMFEQETQIFVDMNNISSPPPSQLSFATQQQRRNSIIRQQQQYQIPQQSFNKFTIKKPKQPPQPAATAPPPTTAATTTTTGKSSTSSSSCYTRIKKPPPSTGLQFVRTNGKTIVNLNVICDANVLSSHFTLSKRRRHKKQQQQQVPQDEQGSSSLNELKLYELWPYSSMFGKACKTNAWVNTCKARSFAHIVNNNFRDLTTTNSSSSDSSSVNNDNIKFTPHHNVNSTITNNNSFPTSHYHSTRTSALLYNKTRHIRNLPSLSSFSSNLYRHHHQHHYQPQSHKSSGETAGAA